MDFLTNYIVLVVMGICACVGFIIKHVVPGEGVNKFIPLVLGVLGVFLNMWSNAFAISPEILLGGLSSGLAATGCYEAVKNLFEAFSKKK